MNSIRGFYINIQVSLLINNILHFIIQIENWKHYYTFSHSHPNKTESVESVVVICGSNKDLVGHGVDTLGPYVLRGRFKQHDTSITFKVMYIHETIEYTGKIGGGSFPFTAASGNWGAQGKIGTWSLVKITHVNNA